MSVVSAALKELMALGVTGEALLAAVERIEEAAEAERRQTMEDAIDAASRRADVQLPAYDKEEHRRALGRARQAKYEEAKRQKASEQRQKASDLTHTDASPETKVSPKPPSKTQPPPPPYSPPPPQSDAASLDAQVEEIWALQPKRYRRATRPDIRTALEPQLRKARYEDILAACRAYYRLPDSTKADGEFAMGAAKLLKAGRWRDFLPKPEPPAKPADAAVQASRIQHLRDTGEWRPSWGPKPDEIAA